MAFDTTTLGVQVTNNVTHEFFWSYNYNFHDWLKQYWIGLFNTFLERHRTGNLKGHFVGVNIVVATIVQFSLNVNNWITGENTVAHGFDNTLLNRLDVFAWNHTTLDRVDEFKALAPASFWLKAKPYVTVLTTTTRLA